MNNTQLKDTLFDLMQYIDGELRAFVKDLSAKQKDEKGSLAKWSAKDVFSHLVFWGNHFNSQLKNAKNREKPPMAGSYEDQVNDGVLYEHMDQPFTDALKEYNLSFKESEKILKTFSADELNNKEIYEYLNGRTIIDSALGTFGWHIAYHISDFYLKEGLQEKATALQETCTDKLHMFPSWEANAVYNLACYYAQVGELDKAITNLKASFITRPDLIEWSKRDSDLDPIRENKAFKKLLESSQ